MLCFCKKTPIFLYIILILCYNTRMVFFYNVTTIVEAKHQIILRRSTKMDRMTVFDRLEMYASDGLVGCELNLYERQIEKVVREGIAVQRGLPVAGWKGQYRCWLGWRYAVPGTTAWHLLQLAAGCNESLQDELNNPTVDAQSNAWIIPD